MVDYREEPFSLRTQLLRKYTRVVGGGDWSENFFDLADDIRCVLLFVPFERVGFLAT